MSYRGTIDQHTGIATLIRPTGLRTIRTLLCAAPLLLASCVSSVDPLSNDETSTIDPRAYGVWQIVDSESNPDPAIFVLGKKDGSKNTLEFTSVSLEKDLSIHDERAAMFLRQGKKNMYFSIEVKPAPNKGGRKGFLIGKYEFVNDREASLWPVDAGVIVDAVKKGQLKGELIEQSKSTDSAKKNVVTVATSVHLTDTSDAIVQYLEEHDRLCFSGMAFKFRKLQGVPAVSKNPPRAKLNSPE